MAMLAEPRKRYKWMYNPRGMDWVNDDNKYGQKLMEKMGWSKGKGLGREEQGNVDHIEVNVKNDSRGIGYKVTDDAWIKHYEGFENVLSALNSENNSAAASPNNSAPNSNLNSDDEESKVASLEALSKSSQARVHYHKFTRGKDLSLLNPDEIACITGSKRAKRLAQLAKEDNFQEDEVGHTQHNGGLTTVKGGNIQDYFAKKLAAFKGKTSQCHDALQNCGSTDLQAGVIETDGGELNVCIKKKEKKKRKRDIDIVDEMQEHPGMLLQECKEDNKKKKSGKADNKDAKGQNPRPGKLEEDDGNHNEESHKEQRQTKKKKKLSSSEENENGEEVSSISADSDVPPKKKKKSKKTLEEKEVEENAFVVDGDGVVLDIGKNEKKLKKKKKKNVNVCTEEYEDVINSSSLSLEEPPKKKKKSKKSIEEKELAERDTGENECGVDENEAVSDRKKDDEGYIENDASVIDLKKKKKKHKLNLEETGDKTCTFDESSKVELKHKKKNKSKHRESL